MYVYNLTVNDNGAAGSHGPSRWTVLFGFQEERCARGKLRHIVGATLIIVNARKIV